MPLTCHIKNVLKLQVKISDLKIHHRVLYRPYVAKNFEVRQLGLKLSRLQKVSVVSW